MPQFNFNKMYLIKTSINIYSFSPWFMNCLSRTKSCSWKMIKKRKICGWKVWWLWWIWLSLVTQLMMPQRPLCNGWQSSSSCGTHLGSFVFFFNWFQMVKDYELFNTKFFCFLSSVFLESSSSRAFKQYSTTKGAHPVNLLEPPSTQ